MRRLAIAVVLLPVAVLDRIVWFGREIAERLDAALADACNGPDDAS